MVHRATLRLRMTVRNISPLGPRPTYDKLAPAGRLQCIRIHTTTPPIVPTNHAIGPAAVTPQCLLPGSFPVFEERCVGGKGVTNVTAGNFPVRPSPRSLPARSGKQPKSGLQNNEICQNDPTDPPKSDLNSRNLPLNGTRQPERTTKFANPAAELSPVMQFSLELKCQAGEKF